MKKRLTYETPEVELVLVRFEENFLQSPDDDYGDENRAANPFSYRDAGSF